MDGPYISSFILNGPSLPLNVPPSDTERFFVRFKPLTVGANYARIIIHTNDPVDSLLTIMLIGWGREPIGEMTVTGGDPIPGGQELYFGRVPIFETKTRGLILGNSSRYSKLRLDSIYFDYIDKQPFSCALNVYPYYIKQQCSDTIILKFNPRDKVKNYYSYLYLVYSDSTMPKSKSVTIKIRVRGDVIFPDLNFGLDPVLEVGKVIKDQSKTVSFLVSNLGEYKLTVDSMIVVGGDADEFKVQKKYPFTVACDTIDTCYVTFSPVRIGSKDARILVYSNDLFKTGLVKIWAECIPNSNQTSITSASIPTSYRLSQNYPNPFNPSTKIEYDLPEETYVTITIYNSIGNELETLVRKTQGPGSYIVQWDAKSNASGMPSGIYFYRLQTQKFTSMKKMLLLK
jgi:hypothetical protein